MGNEVEIKLTVEEKQALKAINKVIRATDKLGDEAKETGKQTDAAFASFKGNLGAIVASNVFGKIIGGLKDTVKAAGELEVFETQFKTILGSTKAAQDQLKELQDFAATTPFQLPGLALSTRQLLSFGVAQEEIIPTLQQLGDLAAGTGANIDELTIPFGRLISTQKLTLIELDKFADRGINLYQKLADQTGVSIKTIRDDISKGKIPFEEFTTALSDLTSKGGIFFEGMKAQSRTLAGVLSTLGDNFFNLQGEIGKVFAPAIVDIAGDLTFVMQDLAKAVKENAATFQTLAKSAANFVGDFAQGATFLLNTLTETETPISKLNDEILKTLNITKDLQRQKKEFEKGTLVGAIFGGDADSIKHVNILMDRNEAKFKELMARKKAMEAGTGDKEAAAKETTPSNDPRVTKEKAVFDELNAIREEQLVLEQENALMQKEAMGLATEDDLDKLRELELAKLDIKRRAELEKASFILDEDKKAKAIVAINTKADLELTKATGKQKIDVAKTLRATQLKDEQEFFSAMGSLANSENKTLAGIGKAWGLTQIAMKTPSAVAGAYEFGSTKMGGGPILGGVMAGIASAAMGAQAAKLAGISGYAQGGVIGGFNGSTTGGDNTNVPMRTGEMVLSANEQKNLFQNIQSNNMGGGDGALMAALSQDIVINIDNREIARANRTAIQEGFAS